MLIDNGADINIKDKKGFTPLVTAHARYTYDEPKNEMIRLLTGAGAKLGTGDEEKIKELNEILRRENFWPSDLYILYSDR